MAQSRKLHESCLKEVLIPVIDKYLESNPNNEGRLRALHYQREITDSKKYSIISVLRDILNIEVTSSLGTSKILRTSITKALCQFLRQEIVKIDAEKRKFGDLMIALVVNYLSEDNPTSTGKTRGLNYLLGVFERIELNKALPESVCNDFLCLDPRSPLEGSQRLCYKIGVFLCDYYGVPVDCYLKEKEKVQFKESLFSTFFYPDNSTIIAMQLKLKEKINKLAALAVTGEAGAKLSSEDAKEDGVSVQSALVLAPFKVS